MKSLSACLVLGLCAALCRSAHSSLTASPQNLHAVEGDTIELVCEVGEAPPVSRVNWFEFVTAVTGQAISDNAVILPSHPNSARYRIIQNTTTHFYLEISNVSLSDGGTYVCRDSQSGPPDVFTGQAELVVIAAEPNCTNLVGPSGVVMEGQNYTITCQIYFQGNLKPTMTWTGPEPFITTSIPNEGDVFSGVVFMVDRGMDTRAFRCTTNFTELAGAPENVATNAPTYSHIFQAPQMFVYWGPKNMYAVPSKPSYQVGDLITCYADAFPPPFYQWQNMLSLVTYSTQVFNVTQDMVGFNTTLRCAAQNLIQGFLFSSNLFIFVDVPALTSPTTPPTTIPTTTPPLNAPCDNLTGWWISDDPYAEMRLTVPDDQTGRVLGFMRNFTDQQWVEVIGRTRLSDYAFIGLTTIWPYEVGVTGMSGECHKCSGIEKIYTAGGWRSSADSATCGDGGTPAPYTQYVFRRIPETAPALGIAPHNLGHAGKAGSHLAS